MSEGLKGRYGNRCGGAEGGGIGHVYPPATAATAAVVSQLCCHQNVKGSPAWAAAGVHPGRSYFDYAASAPYWDGTVNNAGQVCCPLVWACGCLAPCPLLPPSCSTEPFFSVVFARFHAQHQDFLTHDYTSNSASAKQAIDALRNETLAFFGASPDEFLVR